MGFSDFLAEQAAKRKAEWNSHLKPEVLALVEACERTGQKIKSDKWVEIHELCGGLNSWEKQSLMPHWDDALLLEQIEQSYVPNLACREECYREPYVSYDGVMMNVLLPLLIKRFKAKLSPPAPAVQPEYPFLGG